MIKHHFKESIGQTYVNQGTPTIVEEKPFELDYSRRFYVFDVVPVGGVRMTQSDKWKTNPNHPDPKKRQRPEVTRYFAFKNAIRQQADQMGFELQGFLEIIFCVPMPSSWSNKKKNQMNRMPVKVKPDVDNYLKGFMDAMKKEDGFVWKVKEMDKRYAERGSIIVYQ